MELHHSLRDWISLPVNLSKLWLQPAVPWLSDCTSSIYPFVMDRPPIVAPTVLLRQMLLKPKAETHTNWLQHQEAAQVCEVEHQRGWARWRSTEPLPNGTEKKETIKLQMTQHVYICSIDVRSISLKAPLSAFSCESQALMQLRMWTQHKHSSRPSTQH